MKKYKYNSNSVFFVLIIIIVFFGVKCSGGKKDSKHDEKNTTVEVTTEISTADNSKEIDAIDVLVDEFNNKSNEPLVFVEVFLPADKNSGHYRTEFRLNSFQEAIGKSYSYGGAKVDIIIIKKDSKVVSRLYMDNATLEQCNNMISNVSGLIDKEISQADIDYILQYIKEHGEANGKIYGKLQLLLLKGDDYYELMID